MRLALETYRVGVESRFAVRLAERVLARELPTRWAHVRGVAARATQLRGGSLPDAVVAAAWLHDVGYASEVAVTGMHALDGAIWLRDREVNPLVVSLVAFHTGAEFEAAERNLSEALEAFDRPPQLLLDDLIFADLTVSPTGRLVSVDTRLSEIKQRYGEADPVHRAVTRSSAYLHDCCFRASARSAEEGDVAVV